MKALLEKAWRDVLAIGFFLLLSLVYFIKPVTQGLVLSGNDNTGAIGAGQEIARHLEKTGEVTRWTNALFGGMPTYQIAPTYGSRSVLDVLRSIYELGMSGALMYVFIMLVGFYILMRVWRCSPWLSALGAVAWAFSSYFFIIIGAGHIWKVLTLAFIPPTIAGMVLCYRGKYLWGGAVTALFLAFQILSNHLQMTYYFMWVMGLMFVAYLVEAIREHQMPRFWRATATMVVAAAIACAANLSNLYHTYQYAKESMRGQVSLASAGQPSKSGLSKDYITQWSYGIGETWTLLVPNAKGGASIPLAASETAMAKADPQYRQIYQQLGQYWGEQPGTSGPVYVGAFILFLFVLGLFVVKGPMKWSLLAATVLSILLSWGHNFMGLTDFFIDYVPMYNKFRTVASILVIAEFTIPLLAILALAEVLRKPEWLSNKVAMGTSLALTAGAALLFAVMPTVFFPSYVSSDEVTQLTKAFVNNPGLASSIIANMSEMRCAMFTADAWRSFFIIAIGVVLLWLYRRGTLSKSALVMLTLVLCLGDLYPVNKRYFNDSFFVEPEMNHRGFARTEADDFILSDTTLDYRVLNLASNTFNENETSYWHKSIGGYHAAKLGRYQDIVAHCLSPEIYNLQKAVSATGTLPTPEALDSLCPTINMLNTRYLIFGSADQRIPVPNEAAYGNAWFVDQLTFVATPNEEMATLKQMNPRRSAVANQTFAEVLSAHAACVDTLRSVTLTNYEANELTYDIESSKGGVVVFSEIFYPGWEATIDGEPTDVARADYVLRAISVPAGKHRVVMTFRPRSVAVTEAIAYGAIAVLTLGFVAALVVAWRRRKA